MLAMALGVPVGRHSAFHPASDIETAENPSAATMQILTCPPFFHPPGPRDRSFEGRTE